MINKGIRALVLAGATLALTAVGSQKSDAAAIDLAFLLDESGSVSFSDYTLATTGLSNALGLIPTSGDNTYRVGVYRFGSAASVIVPPTVLTAGNKADIQDTVANAPKSGGGTNMTAGFNLVVSSFADAGGLGDTSLINITTDGAPNNSTSAAAAAAATAAAGWDSLSAEAVGFANTTFLTSIAYPTPVQLLDPGDSLPNPLTNSFVLQVSTFSDYEDAIKSKVGRIVDDTGGGTGVIPVPAALPLMLTGFGAMGFLGLRRRHAA